MVLLTRKRLLLAKSEDNYGTSAAPDGTNAVLVTNLEVEPLQMELKEREYISGVLGNRDQVVLQRMVSVKFGVELAGSGVAGTAPRFGPVLKACGFSETISSGVSVTYGLISSSFPSATLDFRNDGIKHLIVGARGTCTVELQNNDIPKLNFEMMGIYGAPTATSNPSPTYADQAAPVAVNADNTTSVSVHGYSACLNQFNLQLGNTTVFRQLAGCSKQVIIPDRKPSGELTIELPALGTKDFYAIASAQTKGAISWQHGGTAGNIVAFSASNCAFGSPTFEDADGIQHLKLPYRPIPSSTGNDEFTLTFT